MIKKFWIDRIIFLALVIACLVPEALRCAQAGETDKEKARIFQEQVEKAAEDSRIPGMVIGVREPDGRVYVAAVGMSDISNNKPMRIDNTFYIGSISQSMLAAMVFKLEEEGRLKLEDPISRFLEFPGGNNVTVEMLMDNSSGFGDWTGIELRSTGNPQLPELLKSPQSLDSLIKIAAEAEPIFEPGERQEGCYTNLLLLSKLIANVERKPTLEVFQERIFKPLGMQNTRYLSLEETQESLAKGYRAEEGWGEPIGRGLTEVSWADKNLRGLADLGIISDAKDVLKYHVGLRNWKLISQKSFERMRLVRPGKFNGLGYQIAKGLRGTWEGNNGHAVGHLSVSYYHVEKGVYIVVMGNLGDTALPVARLWDLRYKDSRQ
jgi:D-alanyl-D-alanine carboxypeptidase